MSTPSIIDVAVNSFRESQHILLQQLPKARGIFAEEMVRGEKHFFDRIGQLQTIDVTSRFQPIVAQDGDHTRRMATVQKKAAPVMLDDIDKLNMLFDPTNIYVQQMAVALGRDFDKIVFDALLGTAYGGKDGSSSTVFDSNQVIANGATGMSVVKLNKAIQLLESAGVDIASEPLVCFIDALGKRDLFGDDKIINGFYQDGKPLAARDAMSFRGVRFIHTELLPKPTSLNRALLVVPRALRIAMAADVDIIVEKRPDLYNTHQVIGTLTMGAVRMEEQLVVDIQHNTIS